MVLTMTNTGDCSEPLDRANTCEQELGTLVNDLREFARHVRTTPEDWYVLEVLNGIEEILSGD